MVIDNDIGLANLSLIWGPLLIAGVKMVHYEKQNKTCSHAHFIIGSTHNRVDLDMEFMIFNQVYLIDYGC